MSSMRLETKEAELYPIWQSDGGVKVVVRGPSGETVENSDRYSDQDIGSW